MQRDAQSERLSHLLFYGAVALIVWMGYRIAQPFFVEIGWALVLAVCVDPVRVRLQGRLGPTRTALVLTLMVVVLLVIPVLFVVTTVVTEGASAVSFVDAQLRRGTGLSVVFQDAWQWLRERWPALPTEKEAIATITSSVGGAAKFLADHAGGVLKGLFNFVVSLGLTLVILFFLIRDWSTFAIGVRRILPFGRRQNEELMDIAHALVSASVTAALAIALVQAILGGIAFALLGIKGAVLWGAMIGVLSFLPMVGATLVWLPAAAWLALSGSATKGLILALVGVLILSNVDNVVRPVLLSGKAQVSTPVLIISLFGGLSAFGFIGVVVGPLVAALLTALVQSYQVTQFEAPVVFEGPSAPPSPAPAPLVPAPEASAPPPPSPQA